LYATFGDWYLAMAAFNCGPNCVSHAVERTGFADFWELSRLNVLPKQTANYVPLILAITIMAKNPRDYDLVGLDVDEALAYDTVDLDAPTNLALVADCIERPVSDIQDLNPALLKPLAPNGYQLRVPKGTASTVQATLQSIPASHRATWRVHKVLPGETLEAIARRYTMPVSSITAVNHQMLQAEAGELLVIPSANSQRVLGHSAKPAAHRRVSHKGASRPSVAATYKGAAPNSKRRLAAN
jgi:membrane-bound lytic murein transglycosylase D